jgi:hypothetical protein
MPAEVKNTTPEETRPAAMNSRRPADTMKNHLRLLMVRPLRNNGVGATGRCEVVRKKEAGARLGGQPQGSAPEQVGTGFSTKHADG